MIRHLSSVHVMRAQNKQLHHGQLGQLSASDADPRGEAHEARFGLFVFASWFVLCFLFRPYQLLAGLKTFSFFSVKENEHQKTPTFPFISLSLPQSLGDAT